MNITNPIPMQFSSTYTLNLSSNPHTLFVLKIIISNPTVAQTLTFYNQNGSIEGQPIVLTNSVEIKLRYVNFSKITFSDTNSYNIFASVQTLQFNTEENLSLFMSDSDFNVVPINNADIIKPLDSNGYVETDDVLLNGKIKPLNQDVNGNVGINVINPLPTGTNNIGSVNPIPLPDIFSLKLAIATANTPLQIFADSKPRGEVTILADSGNTAIVYVGNSSTQYFPLIAGSSITIKATALNLVYVFSPSVNQLIYVITGGY